MAPSLTCTFLFVPREEDLLRLELPAFICISVGGGGSLRRVCGCSTAGAIPPTALQEIPRPIPSPNAPISAPMGGTLKSKSSKSSSEMRELAS